MLLIKFTIIIILFYYKNIFEYINCGVFEYIKIGVFGTHSYFIIMIIFFF